MGPACYKSNRWSYDPNAPQIYDILYDKRFNFPIHH